MSGTTTTKTVRMIGPRPFLKFSKFRPRHRPLGAATGDMASQGQHNLRDWSRVSAPTASKRNVENLTRGWSPSEARFQSFAPGYLGKRPPPSSALLQDETESVLGGRPPPPMGRGRIRRLSTRWLRVCLTFGSGATGKEKGNLKFEKRERLSMWAVRQPLPGQRAALESRLRQDPGLRTTPGAPFLIPPLGYRFKKNHRWKITRGVRRTKTGPKTQLQMASMFVHAAGPPNLCQTTAARRGPS